MLNPSPRRPLRAAAAACALLVCAAAGAQQVQETVKIVPADIVAPDVFGSAMHVKNGVAIITAPLDSAPVARCGSAYIFRRQPNGTWVQEDKITASDRAVDDAFGVSAAIDGDFAVVGAWGDDDDGQLSGSAYVFRKRSSGWTQEYKLKPSDGAASRSFGRSVSISADRVIVGAPGGGVGGQQGAAYVFRKSATGSSWSQEAKLLAPGIGATQRYGEAVAIEGTVAVIGAPGADFAAGVGMGAAFSFRRTGATTWTYEGKIAHPGAASAFNFGEALAMSEGSLIIGAPEGAGGAISSSASIYVRQGNAWSYSTSIIPAAPRSNERFGDAVAIGGAFAVVGAPYDPAAATRGGAAYYFIRDNAGQWRQKAKLVASDVDAFNSLGESVGVSAEFVLAGGDTSSPSAGAAHIGAAYVYDLFRLTGVAGDCNANGVTDLLEILSGAAADCNDNLVPDSCDIASGFSRDLNANAVPDECEVIPGCPGDLNGDGFANAVDLTILLARWGACP